MQTKVAENSPIKKKKYGGRAKGTPNKSTSHIQERCEALGLEPIDAIILFAKGDYEALKLPQYYEKQGFGGTTTMEPSITVDHRIDCLKTLIQYLYPKRKAIEHTVTEESKGAFVFNYNTKPMNQGQND